MTAYFDKHPVQKAFAIIAAIVITLVACGAMGYSLIANRQPASVATQPPAAQAAAPEQKPADQPPAEQPAPTAIPTALPTPTLAPTEVPEKMFNESFGGTGSVVFPQWEDLSAPGASTGIEAVIPDGANFLALNGDPMKVTRYLSDGTKVWEHTFAKGANVFLEVGAGDKIVVVTKHHNDNNWGFWPVLGACQNISIEECASSFSLRWQGVPVSGVNADLAVFPYETKVKENAKKLAVFVTGNGTEYWIAQ